MSAIDRINRKRKELEAQEQVKAGKITSSDASMQRIESLTNELRQNKNKIDYADMSEVIPTRSSIKGSMTTDSNGNVTITGTVGGGTKKEENKPWYKKILSLGAFEDGYDFGDVTKSVLATGMDTTKNLSKGALNVGEGILDVGTNLVASGQNLLGFDKAAEKTRNFANKDLSTPIANIVANISIPGILYNTVSGKPLNVLNPSGVEYDKNKSIKENIKSIPSQVFSNDLKNNDYEKDSISGYYADKTTELVGYTLGMVLGTKGLDKAVTGGSIGLNTAKGTTAIGAGLKGGNITATVAGKTLKLPILAVTGGMSSGLQEANSKENVTETERWSKALSSGLIEGVTEGLFGMFGVGGNEFTDVLGEKAAKAFSSKAGKMLAKIGIASSGEAAEEFLSYAGNYLADNNLIDKIGNADFSTKWDWGEVGEQMALAFASSFITQGGGTMIQTNSAIAAAEKELGRKLSKEEKAQVTQASIEGTLEDKLNKLTKDNEVSNTTLTVEEIDNQISRLESQLNENLSDEEYKKITNQIKFLEAQAEQLEQNGPTTTKEVESNSLVEAHSNRLNNVNNKENDKITKSIEELREDLKNVKGSQARSEIATQISALQEGYTSVSEYKAALENERQESLIAPVRNQESPVNDGNFPVMSEQQRTALNSTNTQIVPQVVDNNQVNNNETSKGEVITKSIEELKVDLENAKGFFERGKVQAQITALENGFNTVEEYRAAEEIKKNERIKAKEEEKLQKENEKKQQEITKQNKLNKEIEESIPLKREQYKIVQENNPMNDELHVGIRSPKDIKTFDEVIEDEESFVWGDFSKEDAQKALDSGEITIYSSYPIKQGVFVSTSKVQAEQYAGGEGKKIYSKTVPLNEVAWINGDEGQYAKVNTETLEEKTINIPTKEELDNLEDIRQNKSGSEYASAFFDLRDKYGQANLYKGINEYNSNTKNVNEEIAPVRNETTKNVQEELAPIKEAVNELKAVKKDVSDKLNELKKGMEQFKTNIQEEISPLKQALEEIDIPGLENLAKQNLDNIKDSDIPVRNNLTEEERQRLEELEFMDNSFGVSTEEELELNQLREKEAGRNYMPDSEYSPLSSEYEMPETITPKVAQEKIKSYLGINEKRAAELYEKIATDENFDRDKLDTYIRNNFKENNFIEYESQEVREVRNYIRTTRLDMSYLKTEFASSKDYNNFRKSHFGSLKLANSGQKVDSFYQELSEEYPQYFSNDNVTPLDQLQAIADFMDNNQTIQIVEGAPIPEEIINEYTDSIYNDVINAEATKALDEELNNYVDKLTTDEIIAPYKGQEQTSTEETKYKTRKQMQRRLDTVDKQITRLTDLANRMNESMNKYNQRIADAQEQIALDRVRNGSNPLDEYLNEQVIQGIYEEAAPVTEKYDKYATKLQELVEEKNKLTEEIANTPEKKTQKQIQQELVDKTGIIEEGLDSANRMSKFMLNNTDPIRIQEMVFGQDVGNKINEKFFQKVKDNTSDKTRWLNEQRNKIKELGIKARSKESAAVQKYAEKKWVSEKNGEVFPYGDYELSIEFPNVDTQNKIKRAAKEIRSLYDEYLDTANPILEKLGYNPIAKRTDYVRHFQELNDKFSQIGIPLNLNDMKMNDLPTDINGITADFKPGKNFFANALQRTGLKTSYDAITGIDGYLEGIGNLIYHTEDIQRLRGFENYIRNTYGQEHGYENLETLTEEQKAKRLQAIENNNLSNYAAWLHEYTNQLAGKKAMVDRSFEDLFGRKIYSMLDTVNKQVGANMIGFNISSAMTNAIAGVQAIAKTNKVAAVKGLADSVKNIFHNDGFVDKNGFLTSRFGSERLSKTPWQKMQDAGYMFMSGTDNFISNFVVRSKFNELKAKGLSDSEAHIEAGKFASKLMADRSQGGQATLYNSKVLGVLTKFQYEVNNQLYSMFYDTFQESKVKSNGNVVKMTASMASTLGQLAVFSHIFGTAFEKMAGYNPTFDIIGIIAKAMGFDDDEDDKDTLTENLGQAFNDLLKALPYSSIFTGGRIPIGEALPVKELITGKDSYGNETSRLKTLKETVPYWLLPTGYGQAKKTVGGLQLFDEDLPVPGSYTDSGNLRFTVEDTTKNRIKSAIFGKWSNEEAQKYIDSEFKTIDKDNVEELKDLGMKSSEYRKYRQGLSKAKAEAKDNKDLSQAQAVFDYIESLNVSNKQKTIMLENQFNANLDKEAEAKLNSLNMSTDEKISFYTSKSTISSLENDYKNEVEKLKDKYGENSTTYKDEVESLSKERQKKVIEQVLNANLNDEQKTYLYTKYYSSEDSLDKITSNGTSVDTYLKYKLDTIDYVSDEDEDGDTVNGSLAKKKIEYLTSSNLSTNDIQNIYENDILSDFDNEKKYKTYKAVKAMGVDINSWLDYSSQEFEADYNAKGKAIPNSKKNKVISYVNSLNLSIPQKAAIIRSEYSTFDSYNDDIVSYVDSLDTDYTSKVTILEYLGATVYEDGSVRWK